MYEILSIFRFKWIMMMILLRATAVKVFSSLNHALMEAVCAGINQMEKINIKESGATIAQWIFIRLSSCSPNLKSPWDVVVVKWSACSPYTPTIRVWILLKSTFLCKIVVEKNESKQKRGRSWPIQKQSSILCQITQWYVLAKCSKSGIEKIV